MVLNISNTEREAFNPYTKVLPADPASLMLPLTELDKRLYFAFCISRNQFLYANTAFKSFFGNLINKTPEAFLEFIRPQDVKYLKQCVAEMQPGTAKNNIEFNITLPDKNECRLRLNLIYNQQSNGNSALVGFAEEIADFKVQTTVLNEYQNKEKAMLNIVSHDLLSPMGSVHNLAALISRKGALQPDPEVSKWILMIEAISKKSINAIRSFVRKEFTEPDRFPVKKECI